MILYIKNPSANLFIKPKITKLTYIGKVAFNINGVIICSTLAIILNKNFNEFKTLSDEKMIV
jgi:hypothetical protein